MWWLDTSVSEDHAAFSNLKNHTLYLHFKSHMKFDSVMDQATREHVIKNMLGL